MSTETQSAEMLHAKVQVGYLILKLKGDDVLTKEEARKGMQTLFPDIILAEQ